MDAALFQSSTPRTTWGILLFYFTEYPIILWIVLILIGLFTYLFTHKILQQPERHSFFISGGLMLLLWGAVYVS